MATRTRGRKAKPGSTKRWRGRYTRRRNAGAVRNKTTIQSGLGFPKQMQMTHKYYENGYFSTGAIGALNSFFWSCNGMFDPNITGAGHQPMYFDQMSALYDHYVVIGSKFKFKYTPGAINNPPTVVGGYIEDDTTAAPGLFGMIEQSKSKHRLLPYNNQQTVTINMGWSAKKAFGKGLLANTELQGTPGANPTEQQYFTMFVDASSSVTVSTGFYEMEVEYIAIWKELRNITSS